MTDKMIWAKVDNEHWAAKCQDLVAKISKTVRYRTDIEAFRRKPGKRVFIEIFDDKDNAIVCRTVLVERSYSRFGHAGWDYEPRTNVTLKYDKIKDMKEYVQKLFEFALKYRAEEEEKHAQQLKKWEEEKAATEAHKKKLAEDKKSTGSSSSYSSRSSYSSGAGYDSSGPYYADGGGFYSDSDPGSQYYKDPWTGTWKHEMGG